MTEIPENYLKPTRYVNSDAAEVQKYAWSIVNEQDSPKEKAIKLYYHIRDAFRYNPYNITAKMKATDVLQKEAAHCVDKACLLAACGRVVGMPSRLGCGTVKNHVGTARLEEIIGTNVLAFHGYMEFYLDGKWVKATPAFNKQLCEKLNVTPLDFDGESDSLFQQYDNTGKGKFMEYLADYGQFDDIPFSLFVQKMTEYYPKLVAQAMKNGGKIQLGELNVEFQEHV